MKKKLLIFFMVVGVFPVQMFAWQGMSTPPLHVEGRYLKDPCGNNIALHGWMQPTSSWFNGRFYQDPSTFTPEDCAEALNVYKSIVDLLSDPNPLFGYDHGWYNNFVRIWPPSNGWNNDGTVDEALQDRAWQNMYIPYIEYCRQKGIYVVLIGNAPDGGTFMSAQHKSNMIAYWTRICNKYPEVKNADNVMFEICNEPVNIESQLGNGDWGSVTEAHDIAVQTYFQDIVNAIRATGANNVIWIPGLIWQDRLLNFATYPISGSNIGYAGHMYPFGEDDPTPINNRLISSGWKACSDLYPVIVTEGSWHTMDSDQGIRTGTTEGFGITVKNFYDSQGNISWICGMTEELIGNMEGGISAFTYPVINCGRAGFDWWPSYASNVPTSNCSCPPTSITPYVQVNDGAWQQTASVTVDAGAKIVFGPQPVSGGSWSWSGCGTSGSSREQTIYPTAPCTSTATYTNTCGAQSTQNFTVNVNGSSSYVSIQNKETGLMIDGMGRTSNGSVCSQWGNSGSENQQWTIETSGSYVRIKNRATGLYVDGMSSTSNGSVVEQRSDSNSDNQQWAQETTGSYVMFRNRATGLYLDGMGSTSDGSDLGQWQSSSSDNQQWILVGMKSTLISDDAASVKESLAGSVAYPIPVTSVLYLRLTVPAKEIVVYSVEGKQLNSQNTTSENIEIDMSGFRPGIYIVKAIAQNETWTQKIMKQ
jgi:hypothetical protein